MSPWQACSPHFQSIIKPRLRSARAMVPICQSPTSTISGKCKTYEWKGLLSNTLSLTFWLNYQSNASNYMSLLNYYIILYLAKLLKWFTTGGFSLRPNNQSQWLRSEVCWSAWPFCLSTRLSAKKRENKYVLICSHVALLLPMDYFPSVSISFLIIFTSFSHYVPHENCHNLLIYPLVLHLVDCRKSATLSATGPARYSWEKHKWLWAKTLLFRATWRV